MTAKKWPWPHLRMDGGTQLLCALQDTRRQRELWEEFGGIGRNDVNWIVQDLCQEIW